MNETISPVYLNLFEKIKLMNSVTNAIASYGEQCGMTNFFDFVDMSCGAVPDGEFSQIIDLSDPEVFLSMYVGIVEARFAFVVTKMLNASQDFLSPIKIFCRQVGSSNKLDSVSDCRNAFELMECILLDGMPGASSKEITTDSCNLVEWKIKKDNHKAAWDKWGGKVNLFYELQKDFIEGYLEGSGIKYEITEDKVFRLEKKDFEK